MRTDVTCKCIHFGAHCDALQTDGKILSCKYSNLRIKDDYSNTSGASVPAPKWCPRSIISKSKKTP